MECTISKSGGLRDELKEREEVEEGPEVCNSKSIWESFEDIFSHLEGKTAQSKEGKKKPN